MYFLGNLLVAIKLLFYVFVTVRKDQVGDGTGVCVVNGVVIIDKILIFNVRNLTIFVKRC